MARATVTISAELETAVEAYRRSQEAPPAFTAVVQAALGEFLARRGYLTGKRTLRISPADQGSGRSDTSVRHDDALAERQ